MSDWYDREGRPLPDDWYTHPDRSTKWMTSQRVARTIIGDITVSTVWLGLNHEYRPGFPPLIFETMTFGAPWNSEMARYSTEEEAMRGHLDVLDRLRDGRAPFAYLDTDYSETTLNEGNNK